MVALFAIVLEHNFQRLKVNLVRVHGERVNFGVVDHVLDQEEEVVVNRHLEVLVEENAAVLFKELLLCLGLLHFSQHVLEMSFQLLGRVVDGKEDSVVQRGDPPQINGLSVQHLVEEDTQVLAVLVYEVIEKDLFLNFIRELFEHLLLLRLIEGAGLHAVEKI